MKTTSAYIHHHHQRRGIISILGVIGIIVITTIQVRAQTLQGNLILGDSGDRAGCSVSMPDAQTLAVGAYYHDGIQTDAGHVRVFTWNGQAWVPKGNPIMGEAANDRCGNAVSMPDAHTIAVGALLNDGNGTDMGHVRVFTWNGDDWIQMGNDIDGEADSNSSGNAISMPDPHTIAIGAYANNGVNGTVSGHVRVFRWNGQYWEQKGEDIDGEAAGDFSGNAVSMPDSNTVAIGALQNDGNGSNAGHVRVWMWNGHHWVQKGMDIDGLAPDDRAGWSVYMPDQNTLAVGAPYNDTNGADAGMVRIYWWNDTAWVPKGRSLYGQAAGDRAGWSVRMPNANTVAFGCSGNDDGGIDAGQVRLFDWNGNDWKQRGIDVNGATPGDRSGWSLSMPNPYTLAVGAPFHEANGTESGYAGVYTFSTTGVDELKALPSVVLHPNPTRRQVNLQLNIAFSHIEVVLHHTNGTRFVFHNTCSLTLPENITPGMYVVEITTDTNKTWHKLMVY